MRNTILMDLDGTLLPFEQDEFIKRYFHELCKQLPEYDPSAVVKAVWKGTEAMIRNDGTVLNRERFWATFADCLGEEIRQKEAILDAFYTTAFDRLKETLKKPSCAREIVDTLRAKGYTVVLATNPIFPEVAVKTRLSWAGLRAEDFALVTHYENSRFCKPNLRYYEEILQTIGKTAEECYMVGNSVHEDLVAEQLGLRVYFVDEFAENPHDLPTEGYERGTLEDFAAFVRALPSVKEGEETV